MKFGTRLLYKAPSKRKVYENLPSDSSHSAGTSHISWLAVSNTTNSESASFKEGIAADRRHEQSSLLPYFVRGGGLKYDLVFVWNQRCEMNGVRSASRVWRFHCPVNLQITDTPHVGEHSCHNSARYAVSYKIRCLPSDWWHKHVITNITVNQHETSDALSGAAIWGRVVRRAANGVSFIFRRPKKEDPWKREEPHVPWHITLHPNLRHTYECFQQILKLHALCVTLRTVC
jgi:hypothetical protein